MPEPPADAFPAPELNSQPNPNLDFYQENSSDMAGQDNHNTDMHAPDMDVKMEGQEVRETEEVNMCYLCVSLYYVY